jgi:hypothetical protein
MANEEEALPPRLVTFTTTGLPPEVHAFATLPEDPERPGARLVPASGYIEVEPGLIATADPKVWRSLELIGDDGRVELRWTSHVRDWVPSLAAAAPSLFDSRRCTFGFSVAGSAEVGRGYRHTAAGQSSEVTTMAAADLVFGETSGAGSEAR